MLLEEFTIDFSEAYGGGKLTMKPQEGPQQQFISCMAGISGEEPQATDFPLIFYGGGVGGGKSWSLLADALKYIDCPKFYGVFFRKTIKQLKRTLWKEAKKMYMPLLLNNKGKFVGKANIKEQEMIIIFPTGATLEFSYLDRDADAEQNWQGAELTAAYFDEFTHFSEFCYNYIKTRMRSDSKYDSFIRCGLNPHATHFVHKYLDIFIDENGYAMKEFSGRPAYFIADKGQIVTSWDKDELLKKYPAKNPRKYTMIPSLLSDNKIMTKINSNYREDLESNDPANAEMLLNGNWKYTISPNGVFSRDNVTSSQIVTHEPEGCVYFRCYDKASSVPVTEGGNSKTLDPDYTASILFAKKGDDIFIMGNYIRDPKTKEELGRYRMRPGERDATIKKQCLYDISCFGDLAYCVLPVDPGQAGTSEYTQASTALQTEGIKVRKDPCPVNKSKSLRFEPFCVATYNTNVYWVQSSFDVATWDYMLLELENFNPLTKNNGFHDDLVDCFSTGWASCLNLKVAKVFALPSGGTHTKLAGYKNTMR